MADRTASTGKRAAEVRVEDATLDGTLDHWPDVPPRTPKTAADRTRLALIDTPGQVHRLAWAFSDVGRAAKLANTFKRSRPSKLSPTATGTFDARAYFDPEAKQWRIAARYVPAEPGGTDPADDGSTDSVDDGSSRT